ncbi:MAG: DUF998 domain-containing protein [Pseudomonadota bacterium]
MHRGVWVRFSNYAGLIALPFYLALILVLGALEPGYSHLTMTMSALGGVPGARGLAFNLGVGVTGSLIIVFAIGLRRRLSPGWLTQAGAFCLIVGGGGFIGAALFHCNPDCRNVLAEPTPVGRIHMITALFGGMFSALAPLFFWGAMRRDGQWRTFATPTLMTGILANLPGVAFWITIATGYRLYSIEGLIQRLGFIFVLIWMFVATIEFRARRLQNR